VFIVQGKPPEPEGVVKVVAKTRPEALQAANSLLKQGMVVVTVIADGRVYTVAEFARTRSPTRGTSRFAHVAVTSSAG
jgi:hypothetical protein